MSTESVDPEVTAADRVELVVLLVIAAGGVLGSLGRYGVATALPHDPGAFAWSTVLVNVTGSFALGLLLTTRWASSRLVRPFVGVGLCGGWTTFSTAMLDLHAQLDAGHATTAVAYLLTTLLLGFAAVLIGQHLGLRRDHHLDQHLDQHRGRPAGDRR